MVAQRPDGAAHGPQQLDLAIKPPPPVDEYLHGLLERAAGVDWTGSWSSLHSVLSTEPLTRHGGFEAFVADLAAGKGTRRKQGHAVALASFDGSGRRRENVTGLHLLGFDFDGSIPADCRAVSKLLTGTASTAHSTWSSGDGTNGRPIRWRLFVPLSRQITPGEHERMWEAMYRRIAEVVQHPPDRACSDPSRLWFSLRGMNPDTRYTPWLTVHPGEPLEVDAILADAPQVAPGPRADTAGADDELQDWRPSGELSSGVQELLDDARIQDLWQGRGRPETTSTGDPLDTSSSGYDFALLVALIRHGITDPGELADVLWHRPDRRARSKGPRYIAATVRSALMRATADPPRQDPPTGDPLELIRSIGEDMPPVAIATILRMFGDRLAGMDALERIAYRDAAARLGKVSARALDAALGSPAEDPTSGGLFQPEPDPWPSPVDAADLLDELEATAEKYVTLPAGGAPLLALWTLHAWAHEASDISPILAVTSPTKRCGKTRLLEILELLTPRPLRVANISTAALFRVVEAHAPTLLVDEADTFLKEDRELVGIFNAGHARGGKVIRCEGDDSEPRAFSTWSPKAIAGIGTLPPTINDRAISVRMERRPPGAGGDRLRPRADEVFPRLRAKCVRWSTDTLDALRLHTPEIPSLLNDREADNWEPLLAIAEQAGGQWPEIARTVASASAGGAEESNRELLVLDIRTVFDELERDQTPSKLLVEHLTAMEDRPWGDWSNGRPMTPTQLARQLKAFGIRPKPIRIGGEVAKGYQRQQFKETWDRYAPSGKGEERSVTPLQPNTCAAEVRQDNRYTPEPVLRIGNATAAAPQAMCNGVTGQTTPPSGGEDPIPDWSQAPPWEVDSKEDFGMEDANITIGDSTPSRSAPPDSGHRGERGAGRMGTGPAPTTPSDEEDFIL